MCHVELPNDPAIRSETSSVAFWLERATVLRSLALATLVAGLLSGIPAQAFGQPGSFTLEKCLADGQGTPYGPGGRVQDGARQAWLLLDPRRRAEVCAAAARAHHERARWEAEYRTSKERERFREVAARFRAERTQAGVTGAGGAPLDARVRAPVDGAARGGPDARPLPATALPRLAPCSRPDDTSECEATPEQILYQIRRSQEAERWAGEQAPPIERAQ
jgi:hypothetical protein